MKIGLIGLGRMGSGIARKLLNDGHEVSVWNRTPQAAEELRIKNKELRTAETIEGLIKQLEQPRVVWLMLPHDVVDQMLDEIMKYLDRGDIVIDGGNSNYKDSDKRFAEFEKKDISFLGIGVSGGMHGERNGFALMAGGNRNAYDY